MNPSSSSLSTANNCNTDFYCWPFDNTFTTAPQKVLVGPPNLPYGRTTNQPAQNYYYYDHRSTSQEYAGAINTAISSSAGSTVTPAGFHFSEYSSDRNNRGMIADMMNSSTTRRSSAAAQEQRLLQQQEHHDAARAHYHHQQHHQRAAWQQQQECFDSAAPLNTSNNNTSTTTNSHESRAAYQYHRREDSSRSTNLMLHADHSSSIYRSSSPSQNADITTTRMIPTKEHNKQLKSHTTNIQSTPGAVAAGAITTAAKTNDAAAATTPRNKNSSTTKKEKKLVTHQYHDYALVPQHTDPSSLQTTSATLDEILPHTRGATANSFPVKLYNMLEHIDLFEPELAYIISWQPHGRCFKVRQPKNFEEMVLQRFFKQHKYTSFQRQLNLYGFNRITQGEDRGSYYHELFLRGKRSFCFKIQRTSVKGKGGRMAANPKSEPNFYQMSYMGPHSLENHHEQQHDDMISDDSSLTFYSTAPNTTYRNMVGSEHATTDDHSDTDPSTLSPLPWDDQKNDISVQAVDQQYINNDDNFHEHATLPPNFDARGDDGRALLEKIRQRVHRRDILLQKLYKCVQEGESSSFDFTEDDLNF